MRNKLFDIIDDEPVVTAPLVNIGPFRKLWDLDKTDDKSNYKKWLLWIYYYADYRSSFYEMEESEKLKEINREIWDRTNAAVPTKVKDCVSFYKKVNNLVEQRTFDSAKSMADQICGDIAKMKEDSEILALVLDDIDTQIQKARKAGETLVAVELLKEKLSIEKEHLNLMKTSMDMIPKVKTMIDSISETREVIEKNIDKVDDGDKALPNYIIDEFIERKESQYTKN